MERIKATIGILVVFLSYIAVIYAVSNQNNPVTWTYENKSFAVYADIGQTQSLSDGALISFGIIPLTGGTFTNTTYVKNIGNTALTINVVIAKGTMPAGYDLTASFPDGQSIAVGSNVRAVFSLTIPADPTWVPSGVSVTWSAA